MEAETLALLLPAESLTFVRRTVIVCAFATPVRCTMYLRASLLSIALLLTLPVPLEILAPPTLVNGLAKVKTMV